MGDDEICPSDEWGDNPTSDWGNFGDNDDEMTIEAPVDGPFLYVRARGRIPLGLPPAHRITATNTENDNDTHL